MCSYSLFTIKNINQLKTIDIKRNWNYDNTLNFLVDLMQQVQNHKVENFKVSLIHKNQMVTFNNQDVEFAGDEANPTDGILTDSTINALFEVLCVSYQDSRKLYNGRNASMLCYVHKDQQVIRIKFARIWFDDFDSDDWCESWKEGLYDDIMNDKTKYKYYIPSLNKYVFMTQSEAVKYH